MPKENSKSKLCRPLALLLVMIMFAPVLFLLITKHNNADGVDYDSQKTTCRFLFTEYDRVFQVQQRPPKGKQFCSTGVYQFEYAGEIHQRPGPKSWKEVAALPCKYINLGADVDRHGGKSSKENSYVNYVGVQGSRSTDGWGCEFNASSQQEECGEWCVCHDLREAIPLPDSSVDRIHSEDFLEHIDHWHYAALFKEIHRLLKPGGRARFGVPDYSVPKAMSEDVSYAWRHHEEAIPEDRPDKHSSHRTLTNYALFKKYVAESPFKKADWLLYFDNTVPGTNLSSRHLPIGGFINSDDKPLPWVRKQINYTLGRIRRTPDVDCRNNILTGLKETSVVFDLVKDSVV